MAEVDINVSTVSNLSAVPGIEKQLAEAIVRHRQVNGRYTRFEELWRIRGMSRSKFQLLRKNFAITGEKSLMLGPRLPTARLSLTESMMNFVCQGQSMGKTSRMQFSPPTGRTRRSGEGSSRLVNAVPRSAPEARDGNKQQKFALLQQEASGPELATNKHDKTVDRRDTQSASPVGKSRKNQAAANLVLSPPPLLPGEEEDREVEPIFRRPAWMDARMEQTPRPSLVLRTSHSGNNINFCCTIDKNILEHPTDMAFHLDQDMQNAQSVRRKSTKDSRRHSKCANATHPSSSHSDYETENPGARTPTGTTTGTPFPSIFEPPASDSTNYGSTSRLSKDNLMMFERQVCTSPAQRRQSVETWVVNVNDARYVGKYVRSMSHAKFATIPRSKSNGNDMPSRPAKKQGTSPTGQKRVTSAHGHASASSRVTSPTPNKQKIQPAQNTDGRTNPSPKINTVTRVHKEINSSSAHRRVITETNPKPSPGARRGPGAQRSYNTDKPRSPKPSGLHLHKKFDAFVGIKRRNKLVRSQDLQIRAKTPGGKQQAEHKAKCGTCKKKERNHSESQITAVAKYTDISKTGKDPDNLETRCVAEWLEYQVSDPVPYQEAEQLLVKEESRESQANCNHQAAKYGRQHQHRHK